MNEDKLANHKPDAQWSKWPKFVSLYYPGVPGGSKNPDDQTEVHSGVSWSPKTQPILKKLWKTVKIEQKLSKKHCFLKVFWIVFNLGQILSLQLTKVFYSLVFRIGFLTPLAPLGACGDNRDSIDLHTC